VKHDPSAGDVPPLEASLAWLEDPKVDEATNLLRGRAGALGKLVLRQEVGLTDGHET
jgi:hypothetical protein